MICIEMRNQQNIDLFLFFAQSVQKWLEGWMHSLNRLKAKMQKEMKRAVRGASLVHSEEADAALLTKGFTGLPHRSNNTARELACRTLMGLSVAGGRCSCIDCKMRKARRSSCEASFEAEGTICLKPLNHTCLM